MKDDCRRRSACCLRQRLRSPPLSLSLSLSLFLLLEKISLLQFRRRQLVLFDFPRIRHASSAPLSPLSRDERVERLFSIRAVEQREGRLPFCHSR